MNNSLFLKYKPTIDTCINYLVLFIYAGLLVLEFRRYVITDSRIYTYVAKFLFFGVLVLIDLYKIFSNIKRNLLFSLTSLTYVLLSSVYFLAKYNFDIHAMLSYWPQFFTLVMLIIAAYDIPFVNIARTFLCTIGTMFIIRSASALLGILPHTIRQKGYRTHMNDLGFGHNNVAMMFYFFIVMAWIYVIRSSSNKIIHYICALIGTIIMFAITQSRTSSIVLFFGLFFLIILETFRLYAKHKEYPIIISNIINTAGLLAPLLSVLITFAGVIIYNYFVSILHYPSGHTLSPFDTFLARFYFFSEDCALNGITLPWHYIDTASDISFNYLLGGQNLADYSDNLYHFTLIEYGLPVLLSVIAFLILWAYKAFNKKDTISLLIISLVSILNIMETHGIMYCWNPFLLVLFASPYSEDIVTSSKSSSIAENSSNIAEYILFKIKKNMIIYYKFYILGLSIIYILLSSVLLYKSVPYQLATGEVVREYNVWIILSAMYVGILSSIVSLRRHSVAIP